jgi:type VI secretion system protein VasG
LLWDDAVVSTITGRCTEVDSGARNVDFILTQSVLPELATQLLERLAMADTFDAVTLLLQADGRFGFRFDSDPAAGAKRL